MDVMITITGLNHYIECYEIEPGMKILLKKDFDNKFDKEAIAVYMSNNIKIGYVANSVNTVAKGTYSSGRLYDKIGESIESEIMVIIYNCAIAKLTV